MELCYKKEWKKLTDEDRKKMDLVYKVGITGNVFAEMSKNRPASMVRISKNGEALNCDIGDVVQLQIEKWV